MINSYLKSFGLAAILAAACIATPLHGQNAKTARLAFDSGNYTEALSQYEKLLAKDAANGEYNTRLGLCYLRTQIDHRKALPYFLAAEKAPKPADELPLYIAESYMYHMQYEEALKYLKKYRAEGKNLKKYTDQVDAMTAHCHTAPDLMKYPLEVRFINLGNEINSEYADYLPYVSKSGKDMVFTTRRKMSPGAKPESDGLYGSAIMGGLLDKGVWKAVSAGDRINNGLDEHAIGLSDGGDTLYFSINDMEVSGEIFTAIRKAKGYGDIKPMDPVINSPFIENACAVSADGSTIIFSANRTGGLGQFDLWIARKNAGGQWDPATNMGSGINSPLNDICPTLSGDGKTLFFASEGHPGMGGYDVFFSTWDGVSKTWSAPQNIGYPVNTPANEKSISFTRKGDKAYITALREDGYGDLDIYEISFPELNESMPAIFHINTLGVDGEPVSAKSAVKVKNEFDELIGEYYPNSITGRYVLALYPGKYFLDLDVPGYIPHSESFVVNSFHTDHGRSTKIIKLRK